MPARRSAPPARRSPCAARSPRATAACCRPRRIAQAPAPRERSPRRGGPRRRRRDVAQNSKAIGAAVEAAHDRAVRRAIANAREEAARMAAAGGLTLGALVSVAEAQPNPFFGGNRRATARTDVRPRQFCGTIRTRSAGATASGAATVRTRRASAAGSRARSPDRERHVRRRLTGP